MSPLERFDLPTPQTVFEHAECCHLMAFLEQYVDEVVIGKTSIVELRTDIECARAELEKLLQACIDDHNNRNPF